MTPLARARSQRGGPPARHRILRKIAAGEYEGMGDVTTLAEPEVVEKLIAQHTELVNGKS